MKPSEGLIIKLHIVTTDASDKEIGAILFPTDGEGRERMVWFWSQQLSQSKIKYSVSEKEARSNERSGVVVNIFVGSVLHLPD